jgi:hypothetical protein
MDELPSSGTAGDEREDPVPIFGSWPRIYGAALFCLLGVMVFIALFSRWRW